MPNLPANRSKTSPLGRNSRGLVHGGVAEISEPGATGEIFQSHYAFGKKKKNAHDKARVRLSVRKTGAGPPSVDLRPLERRRPLSRDGEGRMKWREHQHATARLPVRACGWSLRPHLPPPLPLPSPAIWGGGALIWAPCSCSSPGAPCWARTSRRPPASAGSSSGRFCCTRAASRWSLWKEPGGAGAGARRRRRLADALALPGGGRLTFR